MTEDEKDKNKLIGFVIGVAAVTIIWIVIADIVEHCKVNWGYLTFRHRTYNVTLYDSLDIPEKDKDLEQ